MKKASSLRLGSYFGVSKQTEIIIFSFIGILVTILEASLLDLRSNMYRIWDVKMDPSKFSERIEHYMKYLLSGVVLVRTFTVHLYLGCYIVLLYPAIFADRPGLLLPWMLVSAVKNLLTATVSLTAGVFTCIPYCFMQPTCWEFLLSQVIDNSPSVYMFFIVISYYRDLKTMLRLVPFIKPSTQMQLRRKPKSTTEDNPTNESTDKLTSSSTIDDVFHLTATLSRGTTRSLDTLLDQMRDEDEDQIETLEGVSNLNVTEFTTKMLQLSSKDINDARMGRDKRVREGRKGCKSMNSMYSFNRLREKVQVIPKFVSNVMPMMSSEVEIKTVMPERILSDVSVESESSRASYRLEGNVEGIRLIASMVEKDKTARRRTFATISKLKKPSANTSSSKIEGILVDSVGSDRTVKLKPEEDEHFSGKLSDSNKVKK